MTKEKILKKIESLKNEFQEKLKSLERELEEIEEKDAVFNPYLLKVKDNVEGSMDYFYIYHNGKIEKIGYHARESVNYKYNIFNSSSYAELRQREIDLRDRMWEFSYRNGWKDECLPDGNEERYYIAYHILDNKSYVYKTYVPLANSVYFVSKDVAKKAKKTFGKDIKKLFKLRANIAKENSEDD